MNEKGEKSLRIFKILSCSLVPLKRDSALITIFPALTLARIARFGPCRAIFMRPWRGWSHVPAAYDLQRERPIQDEQAGGREPIGEQGRVPGPIFQCKGDPVSLAEL